MLFYLIRKVETKPGKSIFRKKNFAGSTSVSVFTDIHLLKNLFKVKILSCFLTGLVRFYRYAISPLLPAACRYAPTCSQYMLEAIRMHGPFRGTAMGLRRIGRCHPWGGHGYDPVPPKNEPPEVTK